MDYSADIRRTRNALKEHLEYHLKTDANLIDTDNIIESLKSYIDSAITKLEKKLIFRIENITVNNNDNIVDENQDKSKKKSINSSKQYIPSNVTNIETVNTSNLKKKESKVVVNQDLQSILSTLKNLDAK